MSNQVQCHLHHPPLSNEGDHSIASFALSAVSSTAEVIKEHDATYLGVTAELRSRSLRGDNVCMRVGRLYQGVRAILRQPSRAYCGAFTAATGTAQLVGGNPLGVLSLMAGSKELHNMLHLGSTDDLQSAISDVKAEISALEMMHEGNQKSCEKLTGYLDATMKRLHELDKRYIDLLEHTHDTDQVLADAMTQSLTIYKEGIKEHQSGLKKLHEAQELFVEGKKKRGPLTVLLRTTERAVNATESRRMKEVLAACERAGTHYKDFVDAEELFDTAQTFLDQGLELIVSGNTRTDKAIQDCFNAMAQARERLRQAVDELREAQAAHGEAKESAGNAQEEVKVLRRQLSKMSTIFELLKQDVQRVETIARWQVPPEVAATMVATATMASGPLGYGIATTGVLAVSSGEMVQHAGWLASKTSSLVSWLRPPKPTQNSIQKGENMNITFGPSAGINCCWGGTSRTQGTLEITVNGSTSSLPFNLNYEDPIPKAKIIEWIQNVLKELETNRHPKEAFQELRSVWVSLCQKKWIRPTTTTEFSLVSPQTQKFLSSMLGIEESA